MALRGEVLVGPPELPAEDKLTQLVMSHCLAQTFPLKRRSVLLRSMFPLPPSVASLFERRSLVYGMHVCSHGTLALLEEVHQLPIRTISKAALRARGVVSNDQVYLEIIGLLRNNVLIVCVPACVQRSGACVAHACACVRGGPFVHCGSPATCRTGCECKS